MTQLYQSEALIGATLLSLFLSLCLSVSFSLTHSLSPKSHLDGVYAPPQVQYSTYKDGEEAALTVAEEEVTT